MKDFSYYTYDVGRKGYKPETKKLVWNVISGDVKPINLFDYNWVFLKDGLLYAKKHYANDFDKFAEHVRSWLQYQYWARCEYEIIVSGWPGAGIDEEQLDVLNKEMKEKKEQGYIYPRVYADERTSYKLDVYTQVMLNWDRFIDYVWNNKRLITKKKLGF